MARPFGPPVSPKKLQIGKGLKSRSLTPDLGTIPGGLSMGMEDALVGVKGANRRQTPKGMLGVRTLQGGMGSSAVGGRLRKLGR